MNPFVENPEIITVITQFYHKFYNDFMIVIEAGYTSFCSELVQYNKELTKMLTFITKNMKFLKQFISNKKTEI